MSPSRKRTAADELQGQFEVSERSGLRGVEVARGTQRYEPKPRDDEPALAKRMREVVRGHPRWGHRGVAWQASDTRVYRLWRREVLKCL